MSMLEAVEPTSGEINEEEAREMALFLVRIFGDEAADVAAERSAKSDQKQ